jgi:hypothetical protein
MPKSDVQKRHQVGGFLWHVDNVQIQGMSEITSLESAD